MKIVLRIIVLVINLTLIFFYQISLAETIEKVIENSVIEPIPGKSPEQLITLEEAKETIITLKQDLEKALLVSVPQPPEEDRPLLRDVEINLEQIGDVAIPAPNTRINPSDLERIQGPPHLDLYQRPRITFFDRNSLPSSEPLNLIHQDLRYYIYGPSYFGLSYFRPSYLTYLTRKWSAVSDTDTDDTLLYPSFGASYKMTSTLTITQSSNE